MLPTNRQLAVGTRQAWQECDQKLAVFSQCSRPSQSYVFHNLDLFHHQWTAWDHELEKTISSYWVNFATSGDPNGGGLPQWPAYSPSAHEQAMILGDAVRVGPSRLDPQKMAFVDAYYAQLLTH